MTKKRKPFINWPYHFPYIFLVEISRSAFPGRDAASGLDAAPRPEVELRKTEAVWFHIGDFSAAGTKNTDYIRAAAPAADPGRIGKV